jgi:hypothetical protein
MEIGCPLTHWPGLVRATVNRPPLDETGDPVTETALEDPAMLYGGDPPKTATSVVALLAQMFRYGPVKVMDDGDAKKAGVLPVYCAITKLVLRNAPLETSVI